MMRQIFYKVIICTCMLMACFVSKAQNAYYFHFHDKGIQVFYTDMVDSMTVSKVDLEGIEHDEFVTQQVWMNDTVFNYALADIDSVSFVTPSTIYQPGVVKLEEGLENYVVSHDAMTITLSKDTPTKLLPKNKDKLVYLQQTELFPSGFAGEVMEVHKNSNAYIVSCAMVKLSEIFVRYYSTSNVPKTRAVSPNYAPNEVKWNPGKLYYPLTNPLLGFVSKNINEDISIGSEFDAYVNVEPEVSIRGTLIISPEEGTYVCVSSTGKYEVTSHLALAGTLQAEKKWMFTGEKRWQKSIPNCPLLVVFVEPGVFVRSSLSSEIDATLTQKATSYFLLNMSTKKRENLRNQPLTFRVEESNSDIEGSISGNLKAGVYTEVGVAINDLDFYTDDLAKLYAKGEVGVNLEGNLVVNNKFLQKGMENTEVYELLKNSGVKSNFYWGTEIGYQLSVPIIKLNFGNNIGWEGCIGEPLFDKRLAPKFSNTYAYREHGDFSTITAKAGVEGDCLMPVEVGFGAFDANGSKVASKYYSKKFANEKSSYSDYSVAMENMSTVKDYELSPVIKLFGHELKAYPSVGVEKTLTLSTYEATDVTESSAKISGGLIGYDKKTENPKVGLVYGTKDAFMQGHATYVSCGTVNGSPSSIFEQTLSGLKDETEYLYVAKAELDGEIVYADTLSFTTLKKEKDETSLKEGLALFYESTGGSNWKQNGGWLSDEWPLDYWHGVRSGNYGLSLQLNDNNLVGDAILKNIDNICDIDLSDNTLQSFKIEGGSITSWGSRFSLKNGKATNLWITMDNVNVSASNVTFYAQKSNMQSAYIKNCKFEEKDGTTICFDKDVTKTNPQYGYDVVVEKCSNIRSLQGFASELEPGKWVDYNMLDVSEIKILNCTFPMSGFYLFCAKPTSFVMKDCAASQEQAYASFQDCEIDKVVIENSLLSGIFVDGVYEIDGGGLYSTGAKIKSMVLDNVGSRSFQFTCQKGGYVGSLIIRNCTESLSIETAESIDVSLENCTFEHISEWGAENIYHITNCVFRFNKRITSFVGTAKQLEELLNAM